MAAKKATRLVPKLRFPEFEGAPSWSAIRGAELFDSINNRNAKGELPVLAITQEHGAVPRDQIDYHVTVSEKSVASYKEVCNGDFIISLRSFQGGIEYSYFHGICSPAYIILRRKRSDSEHFFRHLFKTGRFIRQLTRNIEGLRDGKMISFAQFSEQQIPLPPTATEQQKIADCLGSLDDLIAAEGRKLDALRQHKKGLMQRLFPRPERFENGRRIPGETVPRLRFPEFQSTGEWQKATLDRLIDVASGQVDPTEEPYCDLPHVGGENIESKTGQIRDVKTARKLGLKSGKYVFDNSDVLYSKIRPALNKVAAPDFSGICSADIYPIRPKNKKLLRAYLLYLLQSEKFLEYAIKSSDRSKIPKINREALLAYATGIPHPDEQERIANCLTSLDMLAADQADKCEALANHKRGLLQQLFPSLEGKKR